MKILLTGARGQLGRTLTAYFAQWHEVVAANRPDFDLLKPDSIHQVVGSSAPDVVIHCAALPDVDFCHLHPQKAYAVNADGTKHLAKACARVGVRLIYISTDYVFKGDARAPYREDAPACPETVYGRSKLEGEQAALELLPDSAVICRTAWHYASGGHGFLQKMLRAAFDPNSKALEAINDQYGTPTSTRTIAAGLKAILARPDVHGILHLSCEGGTTRYDFACELLRQLRVQKPVLPRSLSDDPRPVKRPAYTVLSKARWRQWGLEPLPDWQNDLADFLALGIPQ